MALTLKPHQLDALERMQNGCILCGGVGSGKSLTSLAYYYMQNDGCTPALFGDGFIPMKDPCDLYIITTARKRDEKEWDKELSNFCLCTDPELNYYENKVVVDSWNNIKKYIGVKDAFFIFDEQRVVGYGQWTESFLKITKANRWILLSATPGDRWSDYMPVFIANGFYRNKKDFNNRHVIFKPYTNYPVIDRYIGVGRLIRLRDRILVPMDFERNTVRHNIDIMCGYDISIYRLTMKRRKDPETGEPFMNAAGLCGALRKIVNTDPGRIQEVLDIHKSHKKVIIFYNYNYELDILKGADYGEETQIAEWNGFKHQPIPEGEDWVYLVQYNAGAEGWNCICTDTIIFYSQTYSYRTLEQAMGRIDRMNTPFIDLYYYHLRSSAPIDMAIKRAIKAKKKFNEEGFVRTC